ncbi:MAG: hypothetical protein JOZ02_08415 [Acidobacteria bacterium]|nr:hypothetical protein [Acidobacteriota bacterium]
MKKAYFSPVTSLLMSLSLAVGILVSDLSGYRLLTSAHAQATTCDGPGGDGTVVTDSVNIVDGLILSGITTRNVTVNGTVLGQAVIAGSVHLADATVVNSTSLIQTSGVIVGSDILCTDGVIVGSDGVIVGSDTPGPSRNGVIVGSDSPTPNLSGVTGDTSGTAVGGTLTGDDITITDGVITGHNLLLSGTTIDQGSVSGTITSVTITPAN